MAHNKRNSHNMAGLAQSLSMTNVAGSSHGSATGDEEVPPESDEPPDNHILFRKVFSSRYEGHTYKGDDKHIASSYSNHDRKESLLTQALLSSPELNPSSDADAPIFTSDGGLTSPARSTTPSPPSPGLDARLDSLPPRAKAAPDNRSEIVANRNDTGTAGVTRPEEVKVETGLGRKRCITFACGRQPNLQKDAEPPDTVPDPSKTPKTTAPNKRPCMLKFVCPMRPSREEKQETNSRVVPPSASKLPDVPTTLKADMKTPDSDRQEHRESTLPVEEAPIKSNDIKSVVIPGNRKKSFNRRDYQDCEATKFHAFGSPLDASDEWTNEQTAFRHRITISDTLRKETAIRKLAEEAEEDDIDEDADLSDDDDDVEDASEHPSLKYGGHASDDGNESDDEEGFADSDDDSDSDSDYQFWTPCLTTAATSTEFLDHIRPVTHRMTSEASVDFKDKARDNLSQHSQDLSLRMQHLRARSPEMPDSSDFVVGTIDEDRPLEDAYMSCLEQRRRSKHRIIPQDIDPSFPTSEPDADNDSHDDDIVVSHDSRPDGTASENEALASGKEDTSALASPTHVQPSPNKHSYRHRSPPPQRLFGQRSHRLRSPPPLHRRIASPPSSRRPSSHGSSSSKAQVCVPRLAQRPNLTHTTSLPRTPNPFWGRHRRSRLQGVENTSTGTSPKDVRGLRQEAHSRGPIDIVQGLETKRQRRKEKYWRQHCRSGTKDKFRCHPGKGAERMKELGLEMADRCRGYGQKAPLVLSI